MKPFLTKAITSLEETPLTLGSFALAFAALIIARLTVENTLNLFTEHSFLFFFFEFTHTFLFFACSFLILLPVVRLAGASSVKHASNILLFGFLIILTPPIIDTVIFQGGSFWSFYEFDGLYGLLIRFFTLFGDTPDIGITYGVRVEVVLVTLAMMAYAYYKRASFFRALLTGFLTYTILFILGTFPSWVTIALMGFQKGWLAVNSSDVAALFLTPETVLGRNLNDFRSVLNFKMSLVYALLLAVLSGFFLLRQYPPYFFALLKNARFPQVMYHGGLLFLGMVLAFSFSEASREIGFFHVIATLTLLLAVEAAWLSSVIWNDLYDQKIDSLTNPDRPLIENTISPDLYKTFGLLFFATSLLFAGIVSFSALLLMLSYQSLAWLYSAPPFRLKRFPLLATLLAAAAGLTVLISGFVSVTPLHNLSELPLSLLLFLFAAYTLSLPLKDFKDIDGDHADQVYTIPVLLGAERAKLFLGSVFFLFFIASPFLINIRALFFPALFCGSAAFFLLQLSTREESSPVSYRKLPRNILAVIMIYGLFVTLFLL